MDNYEYTLVVPHQNEFQYGNTVGRHIFSRLHPFLSTMKQALKMKGINVYGLKNRYAAGYFLNTFIDQKIDPDVFVNNPVFRYYPEQIPDDYRNNNTITIFEDQVNAIINYFIKAKEKFLSLRSLGAKPKEYMSEIDYLLAVETLKIQEKLLSDQHSDSFIKKGDMTIFYVLIIILLMFQFAK